MNEEAKKAARKLEDAIRNIKQIETWALHGSGNDKDGYFHRIRVDADRTRREIEDARNMLRKAGLI